MDPQKIDWRAIGAQLAAPFPPEQVEWRVQGKPTARKPCTLVAYIDARCVQERLDAVLGVGGWRWELEPIVVDGGELKVARGRLTIHGVSKDDVGVASSFDPSKGCASDALKRTAVLWGVGRYLYNLPAVKVTLDERGEIPADVLAKLREALRKRFPPISPRPSAVA